MRAIRAMWLAALAASMAIVPTTGGAAMPFVGAGACDTSPSCIAFRVVCEPSLAPTFSITSVIIDMSAYQGSSVRITSTGEILVQQMTEDCAEVTPPAAYLPSRPFVFVVTRRYLVLGAPIGTVDDREYRVEQA